MFEVTFSFIIIVFLTWFKNEHFIFTVIVGAGLRDITLFVNKWPQFRAISPRKGARQRGINVRRLR